ncbi:MAG: ShlB/FhaC/HecB family hemolysin secretion/activation protein [Gammaproteobacteria bacterium]|nr:ShlB/FhaC/HecB family hemolysin secretion/activation protein [Gammaproteobacteria bacterium]
MNIRYFLLGMLCCTQVFAQNVVPTSSDHLLQQSEQRQQYIDQQLMPVNGGAGSLFSLVPQPAQTQSSNICFPIEELHVQVLDAPVRIRGFSKYIRRILYKEGISYKKIDNTLFLLSNMQGKAPCLSIDTINALSVNLQNTLITQGWITNRILVPAQSLKTGRLSLVLAQGFLDNIIINNDAHRYTYKSMVLTAFPRVRQRVLNLRDLEQGLDNLRRLPTVTAGINIVPSPKRNASHVAIAWKQKKNPLRMNLSFDDSGDRSTGKYLGTISVAWDNPLRLNDILTMSFTHNVLPAQGIKDPQGKLDRGKTYNFSLQYSIPFGYWDMSMGMSHYFYDQVVAGLNRNYHYSGKSTQAHIDVSRVLYRDNKHKITMEAGMWIKDAKNYIDDALIDVQSKKTAGWKAHLATRSYFSKGTLDVSLTYKQGMRVLGARLEPDTLLQQRNSLPKTILADISWKMPFSIKAAKFQWNTQLRAQMNVNRYDSQDMLSIGGRYSIRGFSGAQSLSGGRGWYIRNDLAWHYVENHQLYLGLDVGGVSQARKHKVLSGAVLGLKGSFHKAGVWSYDVFVGMPLYYPQGFKVDKFVAGISLNYAFP